MSVNVMSNDKKCHNPFWEIDILSILNILAKWNILAIVNNRSICNTLEMWMAK